MRKIVNLDKPKEGIVRLMIYNEGNATYVFGFKKLEDCGAEWDEWYESEKDALESCESYYGISKSAWIEIPNPQPNCQHDWINSIRVKGKQNGSPEFGKLEKLVNGKWVEFDEAK